MNQLTPAGQVSDGYAHERERLVRRIRANTNVSDDRVLSAFLQVPRHLFVPEAQRASAHDDRALPLTEMQTISQPSMIAIMLNALDVQPEHRVLEVGAGSGYAAALLSKLASKVHAIEIRPTLAPRARQTLAAIGVSNVHVHVGDGSRGLPEHAPFDRILVSAGARSIPRELVAQLALGGRIAIPVGNEDAQTLLVGTRTAEDHVEWEQGIACIFVPLIDQSSLS